MNPSEKRFEAYYDNTFELTIRLQDETGTAIPASTYSTIEFHIYVPDDEDNPVIIKTLASGITVNNGNILSFTITDSENKSLYGKFLYSKLVVTYSGNKETLISGRYVVQNNSGAQNDGDYTLKVNQSSLDIDLAVTESSVATATALNAVSTHESTVGNHSDVDLGTKTQGNILAFDALGNLVESASGGGASGADGEDAYVYIAYADDASGTGFTNTFDASKDYIAVKSTTTELVTPTVSDFTGLWKNYKGADGTNGTDGRGIQSVALLSTAGLDKTYRITFTDATTFDYVVSDGADGSNGSDGADGSVWREGTGAPANTIGVDGDFYLDDATGDVYQRTAGTYSVVANIQGADGTNGTDGVGIQSITLQSTVGLDKTYRITYTDSTTFDFVVSDGADGADGTFSDVEYINALGSITGAITIDFANGTVVTATLTGAITGISFSNLPSAGQAYSFVLQFSQSSPQSITWPAGTVFAEGTTPDPQGSLYEIPCSIISDGTLTVHGLIDNYA